MECPYSMSYGIFRVLGVDLYVCHCHLHDCIVFIYLIILSKVERKRSRKSWLHMGY